MTVLLLLLLSLLASTKTHALHRRDSRPPAAAATTAAAWPASYTLANVPGNAPSFQGESFVVYSQPMTTKYGEACNERQSPIPLPAEVVARFNNSIMAVTGLEVDVVQIDAATGTERSVPTEDFYNHHYILGLHSSLYVHPPEGENEEKQLLQPAGMEGEREGGVHRRPLPQGGESQVGDGPRRRAVEKEEYDDEERHLTIDSSNGGLRRREMEAGKRAPRHPPPSSSTSTSTTLPPRPVPRAVSTAAQTIPLIQVFCEANGGEYKYTYHGYPLGYAQLISSPAFFWPFQLHFINTRASVPRSLVPSSSRANPTTDKWNGLIECPCSDRRVFDPQANVIDGKPPYPINCQGEVKAQNNTVCSFATYQGGLRCCEPGMVLLDAVQQQPEGEDTYVLKVRYWFQEYKEEEEEGGRKGGQEGREGAVEKVVGGGGRGPGKDVEGGKEAVVVEERKEGGMAVAGGAGVGGGGGGREGAAVSRVADGGKDEEDKQDASKAPLSVRASHSHLFKAYIQTEQWAGEYDIPPCDTHTTPNPFHCIHVLTSLIKASELFSNCSFPTNKDCADAVALKEGGGRFKLLYAAGHMHLGGLSLELINADTGALICRNSPIYDENTGLITSIPPCVWGDVNVLEEAREGGQGQGLPAPPVLAGETRLLSIARYNSSGKGHVGVMASWQMRGAYVLGERVEVKK